MSIDVKNYNPIIESDLYQFLDTNGDGTGTKDASGNYSGGSITDFFIQPPIDKVYDLDRIIIQIEDNGNMDAGSYGNGINLTTGITVQKQDSAGNVLIDLLDGLNIFTNGEWARYNYDIASTDFGTGANYVHIRWSFNKSGEGIILKNREKLVITLNDNFSGLNGHYFMAQGNKR